MSRNDDFREFYEIVQANFPDEIEQLQQERQSGYLDIAACGSLVIGLSLIVGSIETSSTDSLGFTVGCVLSGVAAAIWAVRDKYFGEQPT